MHAAQSLFARYMQTEQVPIAHVVVGSCPEAELLMQVQHDCLTIVAVDRGVGNAMVRRRGGIGQLSLGN